MSAAAALSSPVWLRLIRGDAEQSLYMVDGDETLTVGAAEACGWSVRGADVPAEALELRTLAGCLFVRAAEQAEVRVDGEQLTAMWVPVEKGARLQIGGVLIEVGLSGRSRAAQSQSLTSTLGAEAALDEAADSLLARFSITDISDSVLSQSLCDDRCAATVLEPDARERSRVAWRSAGVLLAGSLLACAYGCWVLLLDHLENFDLSKRALGRASGERREETIMPSSSYPPRRELRQVEPTSLEAFAPAMIGPDDEPIETEELANHFLMEVTQSSHPPAIAAEADLADGSLVDGDAPLEACLGEAYFDAAKPDVRGFERMWNGIIHRELAAERDELDTIQR